LSFSQDEKHSTFFLPGIFTRRKKQLKLSNKIYISDSKKNTARTSFFMQVKLCFKEVGSGCPPHPPHLLNSKALSFTKAQKQWGTRLVVASPSRTCATTVVPVVDIALMTTMIDQCIIL